MALAVVEDAQVQQELHRLCLQGSTDRAIELLDAVPDAQALAAGGSVAGPDGASVLHLAARGGHLLLTQCLLRRGVEANLLDTGGRTALHVSSAEGHAELALELIMARADVDVLDAQQETALHKAVLADAVEVLEVLLDHGGADPTLRNPAGVTPALLAAERGFAGTLQALVSRNPQVARMQNQCGWTPLHLAAHGDQHQRKVTSARPPKFAGVVKMLIDAGADVEARDEDSKTPLHRAATTGNLDSVSALVEARADVSAADICRWTPLHYACQEGHLKVVQALLLARAPVQCESPPCLTPLAIATMENQVRVAEVLVAHKADPRLRGRGLASPLMIASQEREKHGDILALFELGFVCHH